MSILEIKDVSKRYGETEAVKRVNLKIEKGQIYGLIGKNGAGKTTLMRLILGLAFPDQGDIKLLGLEGDERFKIKNKVGALIEQPVFYENLTAYQNLDVHRVLCGIDDKSSIDRALKLVNLDYTNKKRAKTFSLGMKQRLGIAQALIHNPEFLILDEPVNGLDPEGVKEIRDVLLHLTQKEGITVLISSHILSELSSIATHYGFMDKGEMIEEISALDLQKKNQNAIYLEVSDVDKTLDLLKKTYQIEAFKTSNQSIEIFEQVEHIQDMVKTLIKADVDVLKSKVNEKTLETYFLELVGRKHV